MTAAGIVYAGALAMDVMTSGMRWRLKERRSVPSHLTIRQPGG